MDETGQGKRRRAVIPPELVKEVEKLPPDERRWRLIEYTEQHGEEVEPGEGYGPKVTKPPKGHDPAE